MSLASLFPELRERGYRGTIQVVRKHLAALLASATEPAQAEAREDDRAPAHECRG